MGNSTKELVKAFNVNNYAIDKVNTNFTVEGKKIVGLFASGTNTKEYLRRIAEEIIKQHYSDGTEVASEYYNLNYFPFVLDANPDKEDLGNGIVKVKLADSTDDEVIRNLKVHFANEFEGAVKAKLAVLLQKLVGITNEQAYEWVNETVATGAIGSPYLYCIAFSNEYLEQRYNPRIFELLKSLYISEFNSRLEACGLKSSDFYEYKDDMLYIKNVSDKVVRSVTEYSKGRVALDFRTPGSVESKVENCKNVLSELILKATGKFVDGYDYDDFTNKNKIKNGHSFALIPFIEENGQLKSLSSRDVRNINRVFNKEIPNGFINDNFISDIRGKTANPQFANCKEPVYAFSNKQIALLLPKIMQPPIAYNEINGRFEFAVDLEDFKRCGSSRSSSTVNSPLNSPTHAGPSGLRTPPNQRKKDTDSGYDSNSPPKPKDSVAHSPSGVPGPSTELSYMEWESPTRSQDEELGRSPRRGLEEVHMLPLGTRGVPGTSKGFSPSPQLNSIAVSYGVSGPSSLSQSVDAAKNVQAGTNAWSQPIGFLSSPAPSAEPSLWQPSKPSSSKGASERRTSEKPLTEEEKNLFKELLYAFNYSNNNFDLPDTNFIVKNGKIASLIPDSINVKEYLQEVRDKTKEGYCKDKKEAYDLNEFPFKFLSNCEKNQETTVVANISRGALFNLEKLFIYGYEEKVKIEKIDINIIKEAVKSKKHRLVDLKKKGIEREGGYYDRIRNCEAVTASYPDEKVLEDIPIIKDKGGYCLDRTFNDWETKLLLKEQQCTKGTSVAKKGKLEDNKDSGISSGEATDAENVSSKAEATTSSGYESMDCENTREGSPKRKPEKPLEGSPEKSLRRDSSPLSRLESLSLSSSSHQIGKC